MKKLVFMFVAVAAISFASCGQKAQQAPVEEVAEPVEEVVDSLADSLATATDSLATDSTAAAE